MALPEDGASSPTLQKSPETVLASPRARSTPRRPPEPADLPKLDKRKVKKMKPTELKEELKLRGLDTQGNAKTLLARVLEHAC